MKLPVVFSPAARAEAWDAHDWYDALHDNFAQRFDIDLAAVVARIEENFGQFPVIRSGVRRAMLREFPYCVLFRVLSDRVQVIACFHTSRNPREWRRRM